ncbi:MAG: cupin domain-containing protein [Desulfuromonas sp.]|nr:cupin domain-containing protein [Desulfuromonas sp.]
MLQKLIERYDLIPHPEGGFYREVYRSGQSVISSAVSSTRPAITHIYFLLVSGQVSRLHKVCHDEIWNFYAGAPLRLLTFANGVTSEHLLGADNGHHVEIISGGCYQGAETTGAYSLVGCSVAPGFDFADFSFLRDDAEQKQMVEVSAPELIGFI